MFNLLPQYQRAKLEKEYRFRIAIVSLGFALALLVVAVISLVPTYIISQGVIEDIQSQIQTVKDRGALAGSAPASAALKEVKDLTNVLQSDGKVQISQIFSEIISARSGEIQLYSFAFSNVEPRRLRVTGNSSTREGLVTYKKELEKIKFVKKVDLPISALTKSSDINFSLTIELQ